MPSTNEDLLDRTLTRALRLERFKASERRTLLGALRRLEGELVAALSTFDPGGAVRPAARLNRQERLLREVRSVIDDAYRGIRTGLGQSLSELAALESEWVRGAINAAVGANVASVALEANTLRSVARDTLINGARSAEWWSRQAEGTRRAFADRVRVGVLAGDTTDAIVRRVRGTAAAGYTDGIGLHGPGGKAAREAEALVRTSVQAVANEARIKTVDENHDIAGQIQWVSTLDSRTTITCMALDGKRWKLPDYEPVGHKLTFPGPTAHWSCRSTQVPVVKSWEELSDGRLAQTPAGGKAELRSAFEAELRSMGWSEARIARAVSEARASMDGQVARTTTFGDWLGTKSESFQDRVLGPGRARLFRDGKITMADLVSQDGRPLRLDEL